MPHTQANPPVTAPDGRVRLERLSAWLDGESDPAEAAPLLDELLGQAELRRKARDWVLCGDALRSHETAADLAPGHDARVLSRVAQALKAEPALLAPRALRTPGSMLARRRNIAMAGAAVAAVALLSLVVVPQMRGEAGNSEIARIGAPAGASGGATRLASQAFGSSFGSRSASAPTPVDPALDPYFLAHGNYASGGVMPAAAVYLRHEPVDGQ